MDKKFTRRSFLTQLGIAGVTASVAGKVQAEEMKDENTVTQDIVPIAGSVAVSFTVNKKLHKLKLDPRTTLLDCLRENLRLPGTKKGCDHGQCGACTVHVNGRRVNSCLTLAIMCEGDEVTTIEGLGTPDKLHPMQAAFVECDAYQCGYCTSGQIMSASALLLDKSTPLKCDADIKEAMSGNICRCGAYPNILAAIKQVKG